MSDRDRNTDSASPDPIDPDLHFAVVAGPRAGKGRSMNVPKGTDSGALPSDD